MTVLYNTLASLLRALGDSRTPVVFLVMASVLNIGLDLFLILVIPMGVAGAAWATVISQALSGVACLVFIWKRFPLLHLSRDDLRPRLDHMARLLGMGLPMGLQLSITAIGSILLQTSVNGLGSVVVASVTASNKLQMLFACVFDALGVSMSPTPGRTSAPKSPTAWAPASGPGWSSAASTPCWPWRWCCSLAAP